MKAIKPIKASEEIFNDYGPLPRSDLLRRYGYVTGNYAQYDVVEFSFDVVCRVKGYESAEPGPENPAVRILYPSPASVAKCANVPLSLNIWKSWTYSNTDIQSQGLYLENRCQT